MTDLADWLQARLRRAALAGDSVEVNRLHRELASLRRRDLADAIRRRDSAPAPVITRSLPATVKAVAGEQRTLEGWASTGERDHIGDIVEPAGCTWKGEPPLLWHHRHDQPVGRCLEVRPSAQGVWIRARIAAIAEPGPLRDLCETAWTAVREHLVRGLSVGFRPLEHEPLPDGKGIRFRKWHLHEVSLVSIAANQAASIARVS